MCTLWFVTGFGEYNEQVVSVIKGALSSTEQISDYRQWCLNTWLITKCKGSKTGFSKQVYSEKSSPANTKISLALTYWRLPAISIISEKGGRKIRFGNLVQYYYIILLYVLPHYEVHMYLKCRSQWPRGLRRGSAPARLLAVWVRIPPAAWMFDCCVCCQVTVSCWSLVQRSPTDCGVSNEWSRSHLSRDRVEAPRDLKSSVASFASTQQLL
jgi:hypothetical protein